MAPSAPAVRSHCSACTRTHGARLSGAPHQHARCAQSGGWTPRASLLPRTFVQNTGFNVDLLRTRQRAGHPGRLDRPAVPRDRHEHGWRPRLPTSSGEHGLRPDAGDDPFVLVVEGSVQDHPRWRLGRRRHASVVLGRHARLPTAQRSPGPLVRRRGREAGESCGLRGVIAIGQCATFGGYPSAVSPLFKDFLGEGQGDNKGRQTGSMGTYEFLNSRTGSQGGSQQGRQRTRLPDQPVVVRADGRGASWST
jgi:hypothetical protein